ncbi:MAG: 16S rRNA (adenine(1518)-N(6)/adenine(1519)-N(6))-dimethyltransferase RsmA [Rhodobacteraceae bacterium]|nr:16S rRNA (adenine(1518)-N(6)/adenine(1519)-N(6))-dimethyltransferase RsmA [Paracoccaceae bacterium]
MVATPDGLPPLRQVILKHGLWARKALGQNFLLDLNLTSKIARQAGDLTSHDVLEIGPGPGGLTRALLLEGARRVVAIEQDSRCIAALAEVANHYPGRLEVLEGDVLKLSGTDRLQAPVRIVANLPYNVGTALLTRWLSPPAWPPFWETATLMFQKEVANRIVAAPRTRAYGRLSVLAQWRAEARVIMNIPPAAFTPAPKVTSAVVQLRGLPAPRLAADAAWLSRTVAKAFGQRRKMLRTSLKGIAPNLEDRITSAGIKPTGRAEDLSVEEFCLLSEALRRS